MKCSPRARLREVEPPVTEIWDHVILVISNSFARRLHIKLVRVGHEALETSANLKFSEF
jgi:hypothetical protein